MSEFIFQAFFIINMMKIMNRKYDISVIARVINVRVELFFIHWKGFWRYKIYYEIKLWVKQNREVTAKNIFFRVWELTVAIQGGNIGRESFGRTPAPFQDTGA